MSDAIDLIVQIESIACVCDAMIGWTCIIHGLVSELREELEESTVDQAYNIQELTEEVDRLVDVLEGLKRTIHDSLPWELL